MSMHTEVPAIALTKQMAATSGLSLFYTGRECRAGHLAQRYVSNGQCVRCNAASSRQGARLRDLRDPSHRAYRNTLRRTGKALLGRASPALAVGCSHLELREHLAGQFRPGMDWGTYRQWEVDHVLPLSPRVGLGELVERCHYTNLQPLWRRENRQKGGA